MTKEEAREQMDLLNLSLRRVLKEIEVIRSCYCGRSNHYFVKIWKPINTNSNLFRVVGCLCVFCSAKQPLKVGANHCPICNELLEMYPNVGLEDISSCSDCGFLSSASYGITLHAGVPVEKIPRGDKSEF